MSPYQSLRDQDLIRKHAGPMSSELKEMLYTEYVDVYRTSNGVYLTPSPLHGVPVERIQEGSKYWNTGWTSLDELLGRENEEERLKAEFAKRSRQMPSDAWLKKKSKLHSDNVSKHHMIRQIFGHRGFHPNQVVHKQYLPRDGICQMELLYKLALCISHMQYLRLRGELAMDPYDFVRWRINKMLSSKLATSIPGEHNTSLIKSIISHLFEEHRGNKAKPFYYDPLLRLAVLRQAAKSGTLGRFKLSREDAPAENNNRNSLKMIRRGGPGRSSNVDGTLRADRERERKSLRRERSTQRPTVYQGVNAYRRTQEQKRERFQGDDRH